MKVFMSSPQLGCRIDLGASTRARPSIWVRASSTDLVFPVPGSLVMKVLAWSRMNWVVSVWCLKGIGIIVSSAYLVVHDQQICVLIHTAHSYSLV